MNNSSKTADGFDGARAVHETAAPAAHTPGPWYLVPWCLNGQEHSIWLARKPTGVGPYAIAHTTGANWPAEEKLANARLIAAAPLLLAELKKLAKSLPAHLVGDPTWVAIEIAEGRYDADGKPIRALAEQTQAPASRGEARNT